MVMTTVALLWGTVIHRPYVYGFLLCYLAFSHYQLGSRQTGIYILLAYLIALLSELCSTRWGFPFGKYVYIDTMRTQELWISNVPFWDSLSFVFLSYFSWILAAACRARSLLKSDLVASLRSPRTYILAGAFMMLLDVVIDPLTLLGDRWFLGKIYYYPNGGSYFGVTLTNFAGWWFVGTITPWIYQSVIRLRIRETPKVFFWGIFAVYGGVFLFNLGITAFIHEWKLLLASLAVSGVTLALVGFRLARKEPNHV